MYDNNKSSQSTIDDAPTEAIRRRDRSNEVRAISHLSPMYTCYICYAMGSKKGKGGSHAGVRLFKELVGSEPIGFGQ